MENDQKGNEAKESLESSLEYDTNSSPAGQTTVQTQQNQKPVPKTPLEPLRGRFSSHWTIYVPIFAIIVIATAVGVILLYKHENTSQPSIAQQTLSPEQLSNLASSNNVIGSSNQVLTVQSSSIFNGQVLVRGQLQVAGQLQISQMSINKNLSVAGNESVQGTLTLQSGLSVNGSGTFSGAVSSPQITTGSLQLNGNLTLTHHLIISGPIPNSSTGPDIGSGGTTSVSGSDTAGTVTVNTGGGPTAGCYLTVNFSTPFGSTPSVMLTPANASAASINYYVTRSSSNFSVCSASTPPSGQSFVFDYLVIE